jgi:hypothetical protein
MLHLFDFFLFSNFERNPKSISNDQILLFVRIFTQRTKNPLVKYKYAGISPLYLYLVLKYVSGSGRSIILENVYKKINFCMQFLHIFFNIQL